MRESGCRGGFTVYVSRLDRIIRKTAAEKLEKCNETNGNGLNGGDGLSLGIHNFAGHEVGN